MSTETISRRGFPLQDLTPTPTNLQQIEETDEEGPSISGRERIQKIFSSAVIGGFSVGAIGMAAGGAALILTGAPAPLIAGAAFKAALGGAAIGAVRALSFDSTTREVSVFYSAATGAIVGLTAGLFSEGAIISVWEAAGATIGTVVGWAEREIHRHFVRA